MTKPLIQIEKVSKSFEPGRWALSDVSLSVRQGQTLGIVGESGSGKSTLLRIALRLMQPDQGRVLVDGADLWTLQSAERQRFRRTVQAIFQDPASSFNPRQTIERILTTPLKVYGIGTPQDRRDRALDLLTRVGLPSETIARYPHQLSGGQKQRIAIARAVILGPKILLADEPTSALDVSVQAQVLDLFQQTRAELGLTAIFVSHNLAVIRQVSDTVAVMQGGCVVEYGTAEQIFSDPKTEYTQKLISAVPDPFRAFA